MTRLSTLYRSVKHRAETEDWRRVTYGVFLVWTLYLLITARNWGTTDRLFPSIVGGILVTLVLLSFVRASGALDSLEERLTPSTEPSSARANLPGEETEATDGANLFVIVLWMAILPVLLYYVGFLLATPIYLFSFLLYILRDLKKTIIYSIVVMALLYGVFFYGFDINFWPGAFFRG